MKWSDFLLIASDHSEKLADKTEYSAGVGADVSTT